MMKRLILFSLTLLSLTSFAQDMMYSRKQLTPLLINPGLTGLDVDLRASIHHRNQWSSIVSPFTTSMASFDTRLSKDVRPNEAFLSLGVLLFNDRAGNANLSTNAAKLFLSGNIGLSQKSRLSLGLMGGFGQKSIDFGQLTWGNQYDGNYNASIQSNENFYIDQFSFLDVGSGIVWSYGEEELFIRANDAFKVKAGYSIYHLGLQRSSFQLNTGLVTGAKHNLFTLAELGVNQTNLTIIPELYISLQRNFKEIVFGSGFRYLIQEGSKHTGFIKEMALTTSVYYRVGDALITSIDIQYANYTFGFSYDSNISTLTQSTKGRGGFELHLKFQTPNPFRNSYGSAPRFK